MINPMKEISCKYIVYSLLMFLTLSLAASSLSANDGEEDGGEVGEAGETVVVPQPIDPDFTFLSSYGPMNYRGRDKREEDFVDFTGFVVERINLYYYADAKRLMQILNPRSYEVTGYEEARRRALIAREKLSEAEFDIGRNEHVVLQKQGDVDQLERELMDAQSLLNDLNDVKAGFEEEYAGIEDGIEKIGEQSKSIKRHVFNIGELITKYTPLSEADDYKSVRDELTDIISMGGELKTELEALDTELTALKVKFQEFEGQKKATTDVSGQLKILLSRLEVIDGKLDEIEQEPLDVDDYKEKVFLQGKKESIIDAKHEITLGLEDIEKTKRITDLAIEEIDTLASDRSTAGEAIDTKEGELEAAYNALYTEMRMLNESRDNAYIWAEIENMAFAYARDTQPFWVAPALWVDFSAGSVARIAEAKTVRDKAMVDLDMALKDVEEKALALESLETELDASIASITSDQSLINTLQELKNASSTDVPLAGLVTEGKLTQAQANDLEIMYGTIGVAMISLNVAEADMHAFETNYEYAETTYNYYEIRADWIKNTDPINRIFIYAFEDRSTLILRGRERDIQEAKRVIREFDTPAPQARVTLWSLELNIEDSNKGYDRLNNALQDLDEEFRIAREQTSATISIFLDTIKDEVNRYVDDGDYLLRYHDAGFDPSFFTENKNIFFKQYLFYEPEALIALGFDIRRYGSLSEDLNEYVNTFKEMGKLPDDFKVKRCDLENDYLELMKYLAPDPTNVTTLGKGLLVLILANQESKHRIMDEFEERLQAYLINTKEWEAGDTEQLSFRRLRRALDIDSVLNENSTTGDDPDPDRGKIPGSSTKKRNDRSGLNGKQKVIINAIIRDRLRTILGAAGSFSILDDQLRVEIDAYYGMLLTKDKNLGPRIDEKLKTEDGIDVELHKGYIENCPGELKCIAIEKGKWEALKKSALKYTAIELKRRIRNSTRIKLSSILESIPAVHWSCMQLGTDYWIIKNIVKREFHSRRGEYLASNPESEGGTGQYDHDQIILRGIMDEMYEQYTGVNPLRYIAVADQMLKEINKAMEDEIDEKFIQPMLVRLREKIRMKEVNVGVLHRTSMLTTNRKPSRIDPKASALLIVGEDIDILQEMKTLITIYDLAKEADFKGMVTTLDKLVAGDEDTSGIYEIDSGNVFQITPLFDPSGQGLRFNLDYVYSTRIQNADGTAARTELKLPQIDRVTINTEIALSNFEILEVARFESNVKLGISERKSGGVPVLKHIRYLDDIPLIGWFKLRRGKAGVLQQNIIFAQTTIYPTISEIVPLLTESMFVVADRQY